MNPFAFSGRKPDVDFITDLSPEECEKFLFNVRDRDYRVPFLLERPVTRSVNYTDFYLTRHSTLILRDLNTADDNGLQPVLYCRLIPRTSGRTHVIAKLGFYSRRNRIAVSIVLLYLMAPLSIGLGLLSNAVGGSAIAGLLMMLIPLVGPLLLSIAYFHERTHLPYLTVYLRRILQDPSLDPNLPQFANN
ncbi:MAG: hypothetical protein KA765_15790 [Thermoflexales bacterium]|nr:hypothetical protein [Thermoflexales bacterium]